MTPDGYAETKLKFKLHPKQREVLRKLFAREGTRVVFRAANEVGKTSVVITAAVLYAIDIYNARVVSTAGAWRQVTEQLVPNLKRHANKFPGFAFNHDSIVGPDRIARYIGFSTRDEGFAQGYHAAPGVPLLVIIDEAASVLPQIFDQLEDRVNPTWLLTAGSPLSPEGTFYDMETKLARFYDHVKLTQPECLKEDGYWLKKAIIDRMIEKRGPNHPLTLSRVYAEFASTVEGALITLSDIERCLQSLVSWNSAGEIHAFCDFAAGRDENVLAVRHGNRVWIEKAWSEPDTMAACGQFLKLFHDLERRIGLKPRHVDGDADGLGVAFIDRLKECGWPIGRFHGGSKPINDKDYRNRIAEVWHEGVKKIQKCEIILCDDDELRSQLLNRKSRINSMGRLELETKEELKERGVESPDRADAILAALEGRGTLQNTEKPATWAYAGEEPVTMSRFMSLKGM